MIHKQTVRDGDVISLPYGSDIIKVGDQNGDLTIWYEFDTYEMKAALVEFKVVGTGWDVDTEGWHYLDSVFQDVFVWHIYCKDRT